MEEEQLREDIRSLLDKVARLERMGVAHGVQLNQIARRLGPWAYCRQQSAFVPRVRE